MVELPAMIEDELAVEHETGIIKYDKKEQEHNALEDVYLGDGTKVPAQPEPVRLPDIENGKTNSSSNQNALKYIDCIKKNQRITI